ncbi:MerR family transcriptional regulator [Levilactobacillus bambusae]|uniref:MerR family transcriptional regulator n=1 Tax=Levilactobacillus bambusae TaxID=2024736 RepID=A0A2V1MZM8_9LACO|nr:MerR family transcriptional regulator [Levilactobacillus bambusae]PWG00464.1 MerR family transcriptional regulator [Levilactobacillus bambusae]
MTIKEASELTGVPSATIRYYEKEGLIPAIDRNEVGVRQIDDRIIRRINFVKTMRAAGMGIDILRRYIQLFDAKEDNEVQQRELLQEQLAIMEEKRDDLQFAIDHLTFKLENRAHMENAEAELRQLEKQHEEKGERGGDEN